MMKAKSIKTIIDERNMSFAASWIG